MTSKKIFICILLLLIAGFSYANAQEIDYKLLTPLPLDGAKSGVSQTTTASQYLPGIIKLMIGVATVAAVLRIMFAGIKYMTTGAFQGKSDAKEDIKEALLGIVLVSSVWLILYTVNEDLVNFDLTKLTKIERHADLDNELDIPDFEEKEENKAELGCPNCTPVATGIVPDNESYPYNGVLFPSKSPGDGGCKSTYKTCYIHNDLAVKLTDMANDLQREKIKWWVTEMLPPTVYHESRCHYPNEINSGKCVDAALIKNTTNYSGTCVRAEPLRKFIQAINDNVGSNFQYEAGECYELYTTAPAYKKELGNLVNKIEFVSGLSATRQHAHINY